MVLFAVTYGAAPSAPQKFEPKNSLQITAAFHGRQSSRSPCFSTAVKIVVGQYSPEVNLPGVYHDSCNPARWLATSNWSTVPLPWLLFVALYLTASSQFLDDTELLKSVVLLWLLPFYFAQF